TLAPRSMTSTARSSTSLRRFFPGWLCFVSLMAFNVAHAQPTRVLDTAYGKVEAPSQPARIVILDEAALDTALAAGVQPAGTVASRGSAGIANYLQDKA